VIDAHKSQRY